MSARIKPVDRPAPGETEPSAKPANLDTAWTPLAIRDERDDGLRGVDLFLRTCIRRQEGNLVSAHALYAAYASWAYTRGTGPLTQTRFGRHVSLFITRTLSGGRFHYRGCAVDDAAVAAASLDGDDLALIRTGRHSAASLRAADALLSGGHAEGTADRATLSDIIARAIA